MANDDIIQVISDAREDAVSLSQFMYYPATVTVNRRLAPAIHTLEYYLQYLGGLEKVYSQPTGTVEVNGEVVKTVRQSISDAIDLAILGDYQTQLEAELNSEIDRAMSAEDLIEQNIVSLNSKVGSQKLDTGITATAKNGGVARLQSEKNQDVKSLKDFGAKGDGVSDDTLPIINALKSGYTIDAGDGVYCHTAINIIIDRLMLTAGNATFKYIGNYAQEGVVVEVAETSFVKAGNLTFDGNNLVHVPLKLCCDKNASSTGVINLTTDNLSTCNAYRSTQLYKDGDGLRIEGGFHLAQINGTKIRDCRMAVGANIQLSQGIFGVTFASHKGYYIKHILVDDITVENVWSEDPLYVNDQDGIRIFQDMNDATSSCLISGYKCLNVSNRAVKLHSSPNAVIDGVYRVLDVDVIPQTVPFNNPDIDAQQAPAIIRNAHFVYKGIHHEELMRNWTDNSAYRYGTALASNITGEMIGLSPDALLTVLRANYSSASADPNSAINIGLSAVNIKGAISKFVHASVAGSATGYNFIQLSNCMAELKEAGVTLSGSTLSNTDVSVNNITNTSSTIVPICPNIVNNRRIMGGTLKGFDTSPLTAQNIGKFLQFSASGVGLQIEPATTLDVYNPTSSTPRVRLRIGDVANTSLGDNANMGWYEFYSNITNARVGYMGFSNTSSTDMSIVNEHEQGKLFIKSNKNYSNIEVGSGYNKLKGETDVAGGVTARSYTNNNGATWSDGTVSPEGAITAGVGSLYSHTAVGGGLYVKVTGVGNTGWQKVTLTP